MVIEPKTTKPGATKLSNIPPEYCQFADVFDKQCSKLLPGHCPHDLAIQMEEGTTPPLGPIYSLSVLELQVL